MIRVMERDGFKTGEHTNKNPELIDWNGIIRNSFTFSQGLYTLQTPISRWLAMGPLYDKYINHSIWTDAKNNIKNYIEGISRNSRYHSATTEDASSLGSHEYESEINKILDNFQYELDQAFTFSDDERKHQKEIALNLIADGLINRDTTYLIKRDGRPIAENSKRDKWSSFIIDFGLFHKGDGFYTWNSTPELFQQLWEEVLPVIRSRRPDELKDITDKYIQMHPNLTKEEIRLVKSL